MTGAQALQQMYAQRDAKRKIHVEAKKTRLQIGVDTLDFSVKSDRAGYLYVALAVLAFSTAAISEAAIT